MLSIPQSQVTNTGAGGGRGETDDNKCSQGEEKGLSVVKPDPELSTLQTSQRCQDRNLKCPPQLK